MYPNRPNPQKLLQMLEDENIRANRGHLKIFLGAAAGVGKTYAMLKAASQLKADGDDVVIGYIETHGRSGVEALLPQDIEYIPLKVIEHKGNILKEFDIDAVLKRKPKIIILDELAHTNVVGSRNIKRYQDVLELLNAGISVYTALNIQHIESLNDIVGQITEIKVTETVPDQIIETADEVVLIDIPPEELIERLSEGKIYPKEQIEQALKNFFRKGNLTALRELSLRKTAQKVDKQVLEYRNKEAIENVWGSTDKLLLVLEPGYAGERIVRHAKNIFNKGYANWYIGYVESPNFEARQLKEKQQIIELLDLAKQLGATVVQLVGSNPAMAIANCVGEFNVNTIVLAQYKLPLYSRLWSTSLVNQLSELIPGVTFNLICKKTKYEQNNILQKKKTNYPKLGRKVIYFTIVFGLLGLLLHPLTRWISNENLLMVYLLVMIVTNGGRGIGSAIVAAIMCMLSYDFFIIVPHFSFVVGNIQYLFTLAALLIIGLTFSIINGRLRFQLSKLSQLQQQGELFNEFSGQLAGSLVNSQIEEMLPHYFRQMFHSKFMLLLPNLDEDLEFKAGTFLSYYDGAIASWVFNNNQSAGMNTDTFSGNNLFYTPISSKVRSRGVLVVEPHDEVEFFLPDVQILLNKVLRQLATTLERIHYTQVAISTNVELAKQNI